MVKETSGLWVRSLGLNPFDSSVIMLVFAHTCDAGTLNETVIPALAEGLDTRTSCPVKQISHVGERVTVMRIDL